MCFRKETTYTPSPIDTSDVELDETILRLTDLLAKNTHDVWAVGRIAQGWSYGPERNDENKKNPCLVEYEKLSEDEKSYDVNTALETLKCIIKLGYKIVPPEEK
jgi:RyR domain.